MVSEDYVPPIIKVDEEGKKHIICPICGKEFKTARAYGAHWRRHKNRGETSPKVMTEEQPNTPNMQGIDAKPQMINQPQPVAMADNQQNMNWLNNLIQLISAGVDIYQRVHGGSNPIAEKFLEKAIENALLSMDIQNQLFKKTLSRLLENELTEVIEHGE
jgi:uncharacterized C2H2 Zn-finger protein